MGGTYRFIRFESFYIILLRSKVDRNGRRNDKTWLIEQCSVELSDDFLLSCVALEAHVVSEWCCVSALLRLQPSVFPSLPSCLGQKRWWTSVSRVTVSCFWGGDASLVCSREVKHYRQQFLSVTYSWRGWGYAFTQQMANVLGLELPVVDHAWYAKVAIGRAWSLGFWSKVYRTKATLAGCATLIFALISILILFCLAKQRICIWGWFIAKTCMFLAGVTTVFKTGSRFGVVFCWLMTLY